MKYSTLLAVKQEILKKCSLKGGAPIGLSLDCGQLFTPAEQEFQEQKPYKHMICFIEKHKTTKISDIATTETS